MNTRTNGLVDTHIQGTAKVTVCYSFNFIEEKQITVVNDGLGYNSVLGAWDCLNLNFQQSWMEQLTVYHEHANTTTHFLQSVLKDLLTI